ncbi:MAG: hypothetical protein D6808_06720 [Candidatus Dadabacteria bacterium]|nr:MAG: hypothetical protein D6808_06720 [Candidatus Dadabacteria bacterium]
MLFNTKNAFPISLDNLTVIQNLTASGSGGESSSVVQDGSLIGGKRKAILRSNAPLSFLNLNFGGGVMAYSEPASGTGSATIVWDGDTNVSLIKYNGLGGIDFTKDGATSMRIIILSYNIGNPGVYPTVIKVTVYDSSDPSGGKYSYYQQPIPPYTGNPITLDLPFSNFIPVGGGTDFTSVGSVVLDILDDPNGSNTADDLDLSFLGTDGNCPQIIPQDPNSVIVDQCGVCGGDNSSCLDCLGVPNGGALPGTFCSTGKLGICQSGTYDTSCNCIQDTQPVPEVCDGVDNDCDGEVDEVFDQCGVQCGDNSTCADCNGVPNGNHIKDSQGACCLPSEIDECGICGGNGSSCIESSPTPSPTPQCILHKPTKKDLKAAKRIRKRAKKINVRTKLFAHRGIKCGGDGYPELVKKSRKQYQKILTLLNKNITNSVLACDTSVCTNSSTSKTAKKLRRAASKLHRASRQSKLNFIRDCNIVSHGSENRKTSIDYRDDLFRSIEHLPKEKIKCTS